MSSLGSFLIGPHGLMVMLHYKFVVFEHASHEPEVLGSILV